MNVYGDYSGDDDEYVYSANEDDQELANRISAQYGRGDPNEPSDLVLREIETLSNEYISQIAPLLSEAEIQLVSTKFENIEHTVEAYFGKWRALVRKAEDECKNQFEMKSRLAYDLQEAREELEECANKMRVQEKKHEDAIKEYERHQRTLEGVLRQSQPKSRRVNTHELLEQSNVNLAKLEQELEESRDLATQQERENARLLAENRALCKRLGIVPRDDDEDSIVSGLASASPPPMREKSSVRFAASNNDSYDTDAAELRYQLEDLTNERDYLVQIIQERYDPKFTHDKDLTRGRNNTSLEDRNSKLNGHYSPRFDTIDDPDMSDSDLRIDPRVESQMQNMLETVRAYETGQSVFPAASQPKENGADMPVDDLPDDVATLKSQLGNALRQIEGLYERIDVLDSAEVFTAGLDDFADDDDTDYDETQRSLAARRKDHVMKKKGKKHERFFSTYNLLNQQPLDNADLIIQQWSSFESLIKYYENERTYNSIVMTLKGKLEISQSNCGLIQEVLGQILEEIAMSELAESSAELLTSVAQEIGVFASKITNAVEEVIDELQGAEQLVHSDQKRVELLEARVRELENNIPHVGGNAKREAVLATLPNYVSEEFDTELTKEQQHSFQQALEDLNTRSDQIVTRIELVDELVNDVLIQNMGSDSVQESHQGGLLENTQKEIQSTVVGVKELVEMLRTELDACEKFMHPNQRALVRSVREKIEMEISKKSLESEVAELQGKLGACREEVLRLSKQSEVHAEDDASDIKTLMKQARRMGVAFGSEYDASESGSDDEKDGSSLIIAMSKGLHSLQQRNELLEDMCKDVSDTKSVQMRDFVMKVKRESDNIASVLMDLGDELQEKHHYVSGDAMYIRKLEARYQEIRGLYKRKLKDLENMQEFMLYARGEGEKNKRKIEGLERKVTRLKTSTQATTDMRMEEISAGKRVLTYNGLIDSLQAEIKRAKGSGRALKSIVDDDIPLVGTNGAKPFDEIQEGTQANVDNIIQTLEAVADELLGARQFVHPDHDMVEVLQASVRDLQRQLDTMNPESFRDKMTRASESHHSQARDSQISVSHLDSAFGGTNLGERRQSLMAIKQMLMTDRKRRSEVQPDHLIEAETQKRNRESDRRSTQTFAALLNGGIAGLGSPGYGPIGAAPSPSPGGLDDEESISAMRVNVNDGFANRETPANSPTRYYGADGFPDVDPRAKNGQQLPMQSPAVDPLTSLNDDVVRITGLDMYDDAALFARRPSQLTNAPPSGGEAQLRQVITRLESDLSAQKDAYEAQLAMRQGVMSLEALHEQDDVQVQEISELRRELKRQQQENETQQEKYWKLVKEKRDLTIALEEKMVAIDTLELQLLEARGNSELRVQEVQMHRPDNAEGFDSVSAMNQQNEVSKEREQEYLSHINDLIERIRELEAENRRLIDAHNESHPDEMGILQEQLNAKVRELEEYYQNTMQSLMDVISEMQAQQEAEQLVPADFVDQITTQYEDDISKRDERIEELQLELRELEQNVSQLQSVAGMEERVLPPTHQSRGSVRDLQRERSIEAKHEAQLKELRNVNTQMEDRVMDLEDYCANYKRKIAELEEQVSAYSESMTALAKKLQEALGLRENASEFDFIGDEVAAQYQERARNAEKKYKREKKVWKQELARLTLQNESLLKVQAQLTAMQLQYSNAQRNWSNLSQQQEKKVSLLESQVQSLKESKFDYVQKTSEEIENLRSIIRNIRIDYEKLLSAYRASQAPWYQQTTTSYGESEYEHERQDPRRQQLSEYQAPRSHEPARSPAPPRQQYHAPAQQRPPPPAREGPQFSMPSFEGVQYQLPDLTQARTFIRQWNPF